MVNGGLAEQMLGMIPGAAVEGDVRRPSGRAVLLITMRWMARFWV